MAKHLVLYSSLCIFLIMDFTFLTRVLIICIKILWFSLWTEASLPINVKQTLPYFHKKQFYCFLCNCETSLLLHSYWVFWSTTELLLTVFFIFPHILQIILVFSHLYFWLRKRTHVAYENSLYIHNHSSKLDKQTSLK